MRISLLPLDPDWIRQADLLMNDLRHLLGTRAESLQHVGSTAVPGLIAKPKLHIDISLAPVFHRRHSPTSSCVWATRTSATASGTTRCR